MRTPSGVVVLRMPSGTLCQITNSRRCAYGYDQRIEAFCAGGLVRADNETETRVELASGAGFVREPALPFFLERYARAYRLELDAFVAALDGDATVLATAGEALVSLALAEAAERSRASGRAEKPNI